jgi:hypothetical protein
MNTDRAKLEKVMLLTNAKLNFITWNDFGKRFYKITLNCYPPSHTTLAIGYIKIYKVVA